MDSDIDVFMLLDFDEHGDPIYHEEKCVVCNNKATNGVTTYENRKSFTSYYCLKHAYGNYLGGVT